MPERVFSIHSVLTAEDCFQKRVSILSICRNNRPARLYFVCKQLGCYLVSHTRKADTKRSHKDLRRRTFQMKLFTGIKNEGSNYENDQVKRLDELNRNILHTKDCTLNATKKKIDGHQQYLITKIISFVSKYFYIYVYDRATIHVFLHTFSTQSIPDSFHARLTARRLMLVVYLLALNVMHSTGSNVLLLDISW